MCKKGKLHGGKQSSEEDGVIVTGSLPSPLLFFLNRVCTV